MNSDIFDRGLWQFNIHRPDGSLVATLPVESVRSWSTLAQLYYRNSRRKHGEEYVSTYGVLCSSFMPVLLVVMVEFDRDSFIRVSDMCGFRAETFDVEELAPPPVSG